MIKKMIIANDSCNGEENKFKSWMNKNYPEIETSIENIIHGGYYENGERVEHEDFWEQYCSQ